MESELSLEECMRETASLQQKETLIESEERGVPKIHFPGPIIPGIKKNLQEVKPPLLLSTDADFTVDTREREFEYIPRYVKWWRWGYNMVVYLFLSSSSVPGVSFSEAEKSEYYYSK